MNSCNLCFKDQFATFDWDLNVLTGDISTLNPLDSGYSYTRTVLGRSPLGTKIEQSNMYGNMYRIGNGRTTKYQNGKPSDFADLDGEFSSDEFLVTATYMMDSIDRYSVSDKQGKLLMNKIGEVETGSLYAGSSNKFIKTTYSYDLKGNMLDMSPPSYHLPTAAQDSIKESFVTNWQYNHNGTIEQVNNCDFGLIRNIYDKNGRLRFSQDSSAIKGINLFGFEEANQSYIKYYKYDESNRIIENGLHFFNWNQESLEALAEDAKWPNSAKASATLALEFDGLDVTSFEALSSNHSTNDSYSGVNSIKAEGEILEVFLPINLPSEISVSSMVNSVGNGAFEIYYLKLDTSLVRNYSIKQISSTSNWEKVYLDPLIASNRGVLKIVLRSESGPIYFDNLDINFKSLRAIETWFQKNQYYQLDGDFHERGSLKETITNNGNGELDNLVHTRFRYDAYGNVVSKGQKVGSEQLNYTTVNYEFSGSGKLLRTYVTDSSSWNDFAYLDADSSINSTVTKNFNSNKVIVATEGFAIDSGATVDIIPNNQDNNIDQSILPDITYHYDEVGRLLSIGNDSIANYYSSYAYDNHGNISAEFLNQGLISTYYHYDYLDRLTNIQHLNYFQESIIYNDRGLLSMVEYDIESIIHNKTPYANDDAFSNSYLYDEIGRLVAVTSDLEDKYELVAEYDANGNFISSNSNNVPKNYSYYPGTNRVRNTSSAASNDIKYDPNGNIISNPNKGIDLDYHPLSNKATKVESDSLQVAYNYGSGKFKVLRVSNTERTSYLHGTDGKPVLEKQIKESRKLARFVVHGPMGIVAIVINGEPFFLLRDHLGSPLAIVDKFGEPVLIMYYGPHGHTNEKFISADASDNLKYQYTGHENEKNLGVYNFGSRMYDPDLGIFYGIDPKNQFSSPYMAMGGNPIIMVDPDGELAWFVPILIGAAINGIIDGIMAELRGGHFLKGFAKGAVIGAASTAVGMGLANGISSSLGAKSFMKGLAATFRGTGTLQSLGIAGAKSSFLSGALVGGGSGAGSAFTSGTLNGLWSGDKLGESLVAGAKGAVIGGITSGLAGGYASGKDAVKHKRNFWNGDTGNQEFDDYMSLKFAKATSAEIEVNTYMTNVEYGAATDFNGSPMNGKLDVGYWDTKNRVPAVDITGLNGTMTGIQHSHPGYWKPVGASASDKNLLIGARNQFNPNVIGILIEPRGGVFRQIDPKLMSMVNGNLVSRKSFIVTNTFSYLYGLPYTNYLGVLGTLYR